MPTKPHGGARARTRAASAGGVAAPSRSSPSAAGTLQFSSPGGVTKPAATAAAHTDVPPALKMCR